MRLSFKATLPLLGRDKLGKTVPLMIVAHFVVNGEERELRQVTEKWLHDAWATHENVLLSDGNPYQIADVGHTEEGHAHVDMVAPRFARSGSQAGEL